MDVKVYKKEEVLQPSGVAEVLTPDIIDIVPVEQEGSIVNAELLDDNSHDLLEQECALATIFQRGLDPLDLTDGVQWSEVLLGEVNVLQLMEQLTQAVSRVSLHVKVDFSTVRTESGQNVLTYSLREVV